MYTTWPIFISSFIGRIFFLFIGGFSLFSLFSLAEFSFSGGGRRPEARVAVLACGEHRGAEELLSAAEAVHHGRDCRLRGGPVQGLAKILESRARNWTNFSRLQQDHQRL